MRNFLIRLLVAVFTFLIGITVTSAFVFFTTLPEIKLYEDEVICNLVFTENKETISDKQSNSQNSKQFSNNKIHIKYVGIPIKNFITSMNEIQITAEFEVTNKSNKSIYYTGYDKNSNTNSWIKEDGKQQTAMPIFCIYGLRQQRLKPNETVKFKVPIWSSGQPFEIGFDFKKDKNSDWETVWVSVKSR